VSPVIPELLAPAGNRDAFFAALAAGADAVYLGTADFNARRGADNFRLEDLRGLCDLAHLAGRRVYLTLNTAVRDEEFHDALETARQAWMAGVDAAIVHDLGLVSALARVLPALRLHASTQLNTHSAEGVLALAALGVKRVTLARELSLQDVMALSMVGVETEAFAHGALCFCYSGQCLMSSMIGRRSANRGLCAQPCRLPWKLIDTSTGRAVKAPGDHLLSAADLCSLPVLPELVKSGVSSIKIEGRMKSASYVHTVVKTYRAALDALWVPDGVHTGTSCQVDGKGAGEAPGISGLNEVYSRGFTTAYLEGERGNAMMSYARPNNRGSAVGRVGALHGKFVGIDLSVPLNTGDVLEVWTTKGNCTIPVERLYASVADARDDKELEHFDAPGRAYLLAKGAVGLGDRVFRVRNANAEKALQEVGEKALFAGNCGLVPVQLEVTARLGEPLKVVARLEEDAPCQQGSGEGLTRHDAAARMKGTGVGPIVEKARTKALDAPEVAEHASRLGGTPFFARGCSVDLDENVGMGYSALHAARARALDDLSDSLLEPWHRRRLASCPSSDSPTPAARGRVGLAVLVRNLACAKAAMRGAGSAHAVTLYQHALSLDAADEEGCPAHADGRILTRVRSAQGKDTRLWLPAVMHQDDLADLRAGMADEAGTEAGTEGAAEGVAVANSLAGISLAQQLDWHCEAGPSLPVYNFEALALLSRLGVSRAWLGPELSFADIERLAPSSPLALGICVSGFTELMVSEHCVLMAQGACNRRCAECSRRRAPRLLEDRKGYRFSVRTDGAGRSHIYNAVALDLLSEIPRLASLGITRFLVDATQLTTAQTEEEVRRAARAVNLAVRGAGALPKREGLTTGHLYRGML
jgi:putative protease